MKAKLLKDLSEGDLRKYKESTLYQDDVLATYQYSDTALAYYSEYYNNEYNDLTITVFDAFQKPVLVLYAFSKPTSFSHFGAPVSVIEGSFPDITERNKAYKELLLKLSEVLATNGFEEISYYNNDYINAEFYSKEYSIDIEYNSYIDLDSPEQQLRSNLRKSYKSLVNWGEKNMEYLVIDKGNPDHCKFNRFRDFHIAVAGRKTRSDKSWELQYKSIIGGEGYLVIGYLSGMIASGSMILYGKKEAYYGVGVYDRELMKKNVAVGHYNIYYSILHAKKIGLRSFNLGVITKNSKDLKEMSIYRFKVGFSNTMKVISRHSARLKSAQ